MGKKRKIDFVLRESDTSKLIFRFYPRRSSCHSFGDEPPKDWNDVYKVYYSYSIIQVYKEDNWVDICGYAANGGEIESKTELTKKRISGYLGNAMNKPE